MDYEPDLTQAVRTVHLDLGTNLSEKSTIPVFGKKDAQVEIRQRISGLGNPDPPGGSITDQAYDPV